MPTHVEQRTFPYSSKQIFDLVRDVEKYPEFLPWVMEAEIKSSRENDFIAELTIGYKMFKDTYTSRVTFIPYERIDVTYIQGPFKYLNNHWKFTPVGDKAVTVDFFIDFEFESSLMQTMMTSLFGEAVRHMIVAFEKRAKELYC